jgi:hypothetical protein
MFKFLKRFGTSSGSRQSSAAHRSSFRPGVEQLGGGVRTASRAARRPSFRPEAEQLEERMVLSSSGVISSITAPSNLTYVFAVGSNGQVHVSANSPWYNISSGTGVTFRQVSAGLDPSSSNGVDCYAIQSGTGNLWKFGRVTVHNWLGGTSSYWTAVNLGGVCLQISATRNGECYVIGTDHNVYFYNTAGSSADAMGVWDGAVQISAGVDQWGQDQVYILNTDGYVLRWYNSGNSWDWQADSHGQYLRANQISAGIGNNSTGVDLFYLDQINQVHYFNGSTDTALGDWDIQISAGLNQAGQPVCYAIGYNNALYELGTGRLQYTYRGGWMTQISGAQNDMVFVVGGNDQIWAIDPNDMWDQYWGVASNWYPSSGSWHNWGGISANPNS